MMSTTITNEPNLNELINLCVPRLSKVLSNYWRETPALELKSAMEYSMLNGGKYLRPLLVYASGRAFHADWNNLDLPAAAIELMHTYSLIHDDLPCMDNADLRRGKATCHKVYGEGMAVLTGDALFTLAIQILASHPASLSADRRLRMINSLTTAAGPFGMVAGQALDISLANDKTISTALLEEIYRLKTGALFTACIELGWLASDDHDDTNLKAMQEFGAHIGLAFQIQDDILDIEAETAVLGKSQGIDLKNNKVTYPSLHGMAAAKDKVQTLYQEALESINYLGNKAQLLRDLAARMLERKN